MRRKALVRIPNFRDSCTSRTGQFVNLPSSRHLPDLSSFAVSLLSVAAGVPIPPRTSPTTIFFCDCEPLQLQTFPTANLSDHDPSDYEPLQPRLPSAREIFQP